MNTYRKKLIEVALPLEKINEGSKAETENPFLKGHPRSIHNWWARTPLSVARAIIFAQIIDDPSNDFPPDEANKIREELFDFISNLSTWDATTDMNIIIKAREMINNYIDDNVSFWDMFAGRASIPLEAQRLGLKTISSDINPVSVLIQKALMDYPVKFANHPAINPKKELISEIKKDKLYGLITDIKYYGEIINTRAKDILKSYYPRTKNNETIIAWLWARTITCTNPICNAKIPLIKLHKLSGKKNHNVYIKPIINGTGKKVEFKISQEKTLKINTISRNGVICPICSQAIPIENVRKQVKENGFDHQLIAYVAKRKNKKIYYESNEKQEEIASNSFPNNPPNAKLPNEALGFGIQNYGMTQFIDLFTSRQLLSLETIGNLIKNLYEEILFDSDNNIEYAEAIITYLTCALSRMTDYHCALATWNPTNENIGHLFQMQTIPMVWDFAEANIIEGPLNFLTAIDWVTNSLNTLPAGEYKAYIFQSDARNFHLNGINQVIISTDPPYYDNIGYADLSDFFYIWLRFVLKEICPDLFKTLMTPKEGELIAYNFRHGGSEEKAKEFFMQGFKSTFKHLKKICHPDFPITVYYAFKQTDIDESHSGNSTITGWQTMLQGLIDAGFMITATLPLRTSKAARSRALKANALASTIILAIRPRLNKKNISTKKDFLFRLRNELPNAIHALSKANIAPVDLAQSSIGPGMSIFSNYEKVLEADGSPMSVQTALALINKVLDEYLAEQEGESDGDTRWALAWYEQYGFNEGPYGVAETLSKAKDISVEGLEEAGILQARAGKVHLLKCSELPEDWDPQQDKRATTWEAVQHLIRRLEQDGESAAASLLAQLGDHAEAARDLAYRLYTICERKGWAQDALGYNMLVVAWPRLKELARQKREADQRQLL